MTTTTNDNCVAAIDPFEQMIEKYNAVQELVTQMHELPGNLAKDSKICNDCLMRLTLSAAMLLRKIADTGYEQMLDACASISHPQVFADEVPSMPISETQH